MLLHGGKIGLGVIISANDMTRHALLLRDVNMVGKNTLVMSRFVQDLTGLGLYNISHYINSGSVFFDSNRAVVDLYACIQECLAENHGLGVDFVLVSSDVLHDEWRNLPAFWHDDNLKKEVLFFMPNFDVDGFVASSSDWQLKNGCLYIGRTAIFWASAKNGGVYRHEMIKPKLLKNLSIKNAKTFNAIFDFL